jgi:uncharacterized protein YjiK
MKKLLALVVAALLVSVTYARDINEKVLKSFKETFTTAEEVKWEEFETYYTVSFVHSGIRSKVNYDKDGNMLSSIRYYAPQMLPLNIYGKMRRDYPSKSLYGVTEVTFGSEVSYFIKMEDDKNWITVKIDATGNAQVHEKYKKA